MFKRMATTACMLGSVYMASAQMLFTYGKDTVTVAEFLNAYNKNNAAAGKSGRQGLNEYLDLYITSRMKVKEARALGYDTLPQMVADLQNLRTQIIPNYLNDAQGVNRLVEEAFLRQQKDIHLAHIFIAVPLEKGRQTAEKKMAEAITKLQKGAPFFFIAKQYSDDPSAKENGGDLGYITAFTLPYELENLAYSTGIGKLSPVYRSKGGLHLFKNLGERKDLGTIKAAQILISYPPEASVADKAAAKKLADSLYDRLQKGDDFGKLAARFSNDGASALADGVIGEFGVGQYDLLFENKAFALRKDGEASQPFLTTHGWHIVKRISRQERASVKNEVALQALKEKVESSDRIRTAKEAMIKKLLTQLHYQKLPFKEAALWAFSDSVLDFKKGNRPNLIKPETPLIKLADKKFTATDWIVFARNNRYKSDGSGLKAYAPLWQEFVNNTALDYYKDHLETFNPAFHAQVEEFKEGNLFFEIMQRNVWGPAQADTAALEKYYAQHRAEYIWKKSADAVIFYATNQGVAAEAQKKIAAAPTKWKEIVAGYEDKLAADSNRFEWEQIPNAAQVEMKPGVVTPPLINPADNTASFACITHVYPQPEPRSFAEAKAFVINDYQSELERRWVNTLRAKYPVKINQPVLLALLKK